MPNQSRVGAFTAIIALGLAAPALASPISDKYASLGGASGILGSPTIAETTAPDGIGRYRHYQHGSIYWSPRTAAHEVHGLIRDRWAALGWEKSYLGYPMTDEQDSYEGANGPARVTKFQGGELIWRRATDAVSEVKSSDLVIDLPTRAGDPWFVIQANAVNPGDSHGGPWVYCWDLDWNQDQPATKGRTFFAGADGKIVYVSEDQHNTQNQVNPPLANVISQRLGPGRYLSYMHLLQGSYTKVYAKGQLFLPQALPWANRPSVSDGKALAETGDVGAAWGAYHVHYCVTTAPDRPPFQPFESVPVSFRNYSSSDDGGKTWTYHSVGVPAQGQMIRRESSKPGEGASPAVNTSAEVLNYGTVSVNVDYSGAQLGVGGTLTATLMSAWGEPLETHKVAVNLTARGPWKVSFKAPDYPGATVQASYDRPPSGYTVAGTSAGFNPKADQTTDVTVHMKATPIPIIK